MRNWLGVFRIISAILMVLFTGTFLALTFLKKERVPELITRVLGEKGRYDEEKAAGVLRTVFAVFAVLELLNLVFANTAFVPAVCIPAAIAVCYMSLLYLERRCRKRNKSGTAAHTGESLEKDTDDGRDSNEQEEH